MNTYLSKIASDLSIAKKSKQEEEKAILDYSDRKSKTSNPELLEALEHARKEEVDHSNRFDKVIQKLEHQKQAGLEKYALNALKARQIAKAVGVIPDHLTQWKYAIRNLRDNRGNPLADQALESARVRLGAMSNNAFKKAKSAHLKNKGNEIAFTVNNKGNISSKIHRGSKDSVSVDLPDTKDNRLAHTHGVYKGIPKEHINHRLAFQSGPELKTPHKKKSIQRASLDNKIYNFLKDQVEEGLPPEHAEHLFNKNNRTVVGRLTGNNIQKVNGGRDIASSIVNTHELNNFHRISKNNVLTPELGVDGVHRNVGLINAPTGNISLLKRRSVLFKHE